MQSAAGRAHEFAVLYGGERPAFPMVPVATHGATMLALEGDLRRPPGAGAHRAGAADRDQPAPRVERVRPDAMGTRRRSRPARRRRADADVHDRPHPRRCVGAVQPELAALFRAFLRALELEHVVEQERVPHRAAHPGSGRRAGPARDPDRSGRGTVLGRVAAGVRRRARRLRRAVHRGRATRCCIRSCSTPATRSRSTIPRSGGPASSARSSTVRRAPRPSAAAPPASGASTPAGRHRAGARHVDRHADGDRVVAELGARVIKIEPSTATRCGGYGPVGLKFVQGKESITLDLKTTEGLAIVHRLVERADVVRAQLPAGCSGATRHRRRDSARAEPEADLPLRRVVRLDGADGGATGVPRHRGGGLRGRPGPGWRRRHARSRRRALRRGAGVLGAASARAATSRTPTSTPRSSSPRP